MTTLTRILPLIILILSLIISSPAAAQACAARDQVANYLAEKYSEKPIGRGKHHDGQVLEMFVAADGATWSAVMTDPNGISCIVAYGEDWREAPALKEKPI